MTIDEAAKLLSSMYKTAGDKEKAVSVHLFGIKYANELQGMSLNEVVARADVTPSYATEVRKGINLAKYVRLK